MADQASLFDPNSPALADGERFRVDQGDAVEWLRGLAAESVDLILTDPAYESLEEHRSKGTTTRLKHSAASSNDWFSIFPNSRFPELFSEMYRVLRPDSHCYVMCDQKTMFAIKPMGEAAGFKFWKPLVWDKCLAPDTLVWTTRGVVRIDSISAGDRVYTPGGELSEVSAIRKTASPTVKIELSDGAVVVAATDHLMVRANGSEVPASELVVGDLLKEEDFRLALDQVSTLRPDEIIPSERLVLQLPESNRCLWCGTQFESSRAAAAHQARFCKNARSKREMAEAIGVSFKRLAWWMNQRMLPAAWVDALGLRSKVTGRCRAIHQNDGHLTFPESIPIDYALGKFVGLYAAQGFRCEAGVGFSFNAAKRDSHAFVARYARNLGLKAHRYQTSEGGSAVAVYYDFATWVIQTFVGGECAPEKFFRDIVYRAPAEFRVGIFDGLMDGDGHFDFDCHRDTFVSTSPDLAMFVLRHARSSGWQATMRRRENDHLGAWVVRFDRSQRATELKVVSVEHGPPQELIDIAIDHESQLFCLANGAVTHNCKIGMGYHYRARYEFILFFEKGKRKLANLGVPDVLEFDRVHKGYPTEKPVELLEVLVTQSSEEGAIIVDPFMGSGSAGEAALRNGRRFIGNDVTERAVKWAQARLSRVTRDPELFRADDSENSGEGVGA